MNKKLVCLLSIILAVFSTNFAAATDINDLGKVLFIGDSYCMGSSIYNDLGVEHPDEAWATLAATKLGMENYAKACRGGAGFAVSEERTYLTLAKEYIAANSDMDDIRWIIIFAGYNDRYYSYDQVMIEGEKTLRFLAENFPNAQIAIGMVGWNEADENAQLQLANVSSATYRDLADYMNLVYMEGAETVLYEQENVFSADHFHPNFVGQDLMADFVADFLNTQLEALRQTELTPEPMFQNLNRNLPLVIAFVGCAFIAIVFGARFVAEPTKAAKAPVKKRKKTAKKKSSKSRKK